MQVEATPDTLVGSPHFLNPSTARPSDGPRGVGTRPRQPIGTGKATGPYLRREWRWGLRSRPLSQDLEREADRLLDLDRSRCRDLGICVEKRCQFRETQHGVAVRSRARVLSAAAAAATASGRLSPRETLTLTERIRCTAFQRKSTVPFGGRTM